MQHLDFDEVLDTIVSTETRYDRNAYGFVREALDYTQKLVAKSQQDRVRHVSGQELLQGIRKFALKEFGPMAMTVLEEWGIRATRDFGVIVFILIEHNVLAKTKDDTVEDFEGGYSFEDAFVLPFLPASKRKRRKPSAASSAPAHKA